MAPPQARTQRPAPSSRPAATELPASSSFLTDSRRGSGRSGSDPGRSYHRRSEAPGPPTAPATGAPTRAQRPGRRDHGRTNRGRAGHQPLHLHVGHPAPVEVGDLANVQAPDQRRIDYRHVRQPRRPLMGPEREPAQPPGRLDRPPRPGQRRDRLGFRSPKQPDPAFGGRRDSTPFVGRGAEPFPRLGRHLHGQPERPGPLVKLPDRQPPGHGAELVDRQQDLALDRAAPGGRSPSTPR